MITKKSEQFVEATSASVDNVRKFMQTSLASLEKVAKLQLESSKKMLEETSQAFKEISSSTNPKDFFSRISQLATHSVESNICKCRDLYQIVTEAQTNISKLIESNVHNTQQKITDAVESISKYSPTHNKTTDSVKSWINNTNQAITTMQKMAAQVTEFTNNNLKTAVSRAAVKKSTTKK